MLADCSGPCALRPASRWLWSSRETAISPKTLELIEVDYAPLPAIVDPLAALDPQLPLLHQGLSGNIASDRSFRYGDPQREFAEAARKVSVSIRYPLGILHTD